MINLIRSSKDPDEAREGLIEKFSLTEIQAKAILDMRLQRLTGLERDKIQKEYEEIQALIKELKEILGDEGKRMQIIKDESFSWLHEKLPKLPYFEDSLKSILNSLLKVIFVFVVFVFVFQPR